MVVQNSEGGERTAAHWRAKAEEARTLADGMSDPDAKGTMENVAAMYALMAKRAEEREKRAAGRSS